MKWPNKVFISGLEVYMTYFGGTTRRISALDPSTGDFIHIWEADPLDIIPRKGTAYLFRPSLCPITFAADTLKLEFAPAGTATYVEIDAIAMSGSALPQTRNVVNLRSGNLTYVPDAYINGNDSFTYRINKCSYSSRYAAEGVETARVSLKITSVNQIPLAVGSFLSIDATVPTARTNGVSKVVNVSDIETGSDSLRILLRSVPSFGQLSPKDDRSRVARVGDSLIAGDLIYLPAECTDSLGIFNVSFSFVAQDPDGAQSDPAETTISIDCQGPAQRVAVGAQIFIFALSAFGSTVSAVALILVVIWRNTRTILSISPLFCIVTLLGSLLVNLSPIFLTPLASSCMGWLALLTMGVVLFFTPIAAKTYRLNRIFNNKSMTIFTISNLQLLMYVGIPALIQGALLLVWGLVHVPVVTQVNNPGTTQTIPMCVGKVTIPTLVVEFVLLLLLYVFTAYFAWKVRNIPLGQWKETHEIFLAVYQIGFVSLVVIPLAFVLWFTATGYMLIVGVGTNFAATVSVMILFITKFYRISTDQEKSAKTHLTLTGGMSPSGMVSGMTSGHKYVPKSALSSGSLSFRSSNKSTHEEDPSSSDSDSAQDGKPSSSSSAEQEKPTHQPQKVKKTRSGTKASVSKQQKRKTHPTIEDSSSSKSS